MSGPAALLVVVGALYLLECIVAVPGGQVAFRGTARASWSVVTGGFRIGGHGRRLVFVPLMPWARGVLLAGGAVGADRSFGSDAGSPRVPSFDVPLVRTRVAQLDAATSALRVDSLSMFALVFVLSPAAVRLLGWDATWPFIMTGVVAIAVLVAGDYRRAHADLFPRSGGAQFGILLTLAVSPASAMRAGDSLARALVADQHALAVARAACPPEEYERLAAGHVRSWRRGEPRDRGAEEFIASTLGDPARLISAPGRRDESALAYCPGCLAEFAIASGECEQCGVELEPFAERTAAAS